MSVLIPINDLRRHNAPLLPALGARLTSVADSGWYVLGPQVRDFERAFARYCGVEHCIGVGNGTDALELALHACGIGPGMQVATVANAGGYATAAIVASGASPLYVDIDKRTLLLDIAALERSLTPATRAVVATHLYGRMVDMPRLLQIAAHAGIFVIEDCAHAHGARLHGRRAGAWGALGCFSFYPTKNLGALGDAGAVVTSDSTLASKLRQLRQYGWVSRFCCQLPRGRNSRLDEMQAAILSYKLPHLDRWNERRREIAGIYSREWKDFPVELPGVLAPDDVTHLYVIRSDHREQLRERLRTLGVATEVHYPTPDYRQASAASEPWSNTTLPVTEESCCRVVTVPCFPEMTEAEIESVVAAVKTAAW